MKLVELTLQNFRRYREPTTVAFDELTVIVGRNDAGKSSLLDALDIFFNDSPIETDDASAHGAANDVRITCVFSELPTEIILDEQHPTTLVDEFLVRGDGLFEISRVYNCSLAKPKESRTFVRAIHPSADGCADLIRLKLNELKTRATQRRVDLTNVNLTVKTEIRRAIWSQAGSLLQMESEIDLASETGKTIWEQVRRHLPVFALFKSDRTSSDQDGEAQDPMKAAIRETVRKYEADLDEFIGRVKSDLELVAARTVEKIREMAPELASTMNPQVKSKNWDSLFTVSLTDDDGISINKRGSGTRRLVLLNFFRAKAEDAALNRHASAIYAIEEPETSQHPNQQLLLLDAFQDLASRGNCQVILTTHTPTLARKVDRNHLRLVRDVSGEPSVEHGKEDSTLTAIKSTLGVLPDHDVRLFLGVEGKWDIEFLKRISRILHVVDATIPDLGIADAGGSLVFIPLGGSNLELWSSRLAGLSISEYYITDRDNRPPAPPKYDAQLTIWNGRADCEAVCTSKRELENYLHPDAIRSVVPTFPAIIDDFADVPMMLAEVIHSADPSAPVWATVTLDRQKSKASRAKARLNTDCVDQMTSTLLAQRDGPGELRAWLQKIGVLLSS